MPAITLWVLIAAVPVAAQTVGGVASPDAAQVAASMDAVRATLLELEFTEFADGELVVEVDLPRFGPATLSLYPHSLRSDRFKLMVDDGSQLVEVSAPPVRTRKGEVLEIPGSKVRASYQSGRLTALIVADGQVWSISSTVELGFPGTGSWHGIVDGRDELDLVRECGTPDGAGPPGSGTGGTTQSFGTTYYLSEIGIDSDFEYF